MTLYELWEDDEGSAFFPADYPDKDRMLMSNPRLVWTVEADDWEDAMRKRCAHIGEEYKPFEEP